jgi:hypothetical protein
MKECPNCHKDLPEDSIFCQYCGISLTGQKRKDSKDGSNIKLKPNPRKNELGKYAIYLMILTVIVFDVALGAVFNAFGWNVKIVYILSSILYFLSIGLGLFSFYVDHVDQKNGYETSHNGGYALAAISISFVIFLVNLQGVLLK